ncbi:MAG TPA: S9 family peptidase [Kofleriaceae bacterium]|jgi:dipeptidyl aminopeptidase/acylaminoacyl peptidase
MSALSAHLIPREVLNTVFARLDVQLSPDGTRVSWLAERDQVRNVWVAPIANLDLARPVTRATERSIRAYRWAQTSEHILYQHDAGVAELSHIYNATLADGAITDLTPYDGARAVFVPGDDLRTFNGTSPRHPSLLVVGCNDRDRTQTDLLQIDILTGETIRIYENREGVFNCWFDADLRPVIAKRARPDGSQDLLVNTAPAGEVTWTVMVNVALEDASSTQPVSVDAGGARVYLLDSRARDTRAVVAIDLTSRAPTTLAENQRGDIESVIVHPTTRAVQAATFEDISATWLVLDPAIQRDVDALATLDSGRLTVLGRSRKDDVWLVTTSSDHNPGRTYVWERAAQRATLLFEPSPIDPDELATMHPVELTSRDGLTLPCYLTLPLGSNPSGGPRPTQPLPTIVRLHGLWTRERWDYHAEHQLFANRGYAILSVNFRGSTGLGKDFLNAGNRQWGKACQDDVIDAAAWLVAEGIALPDKIAILGYSYGGYESLLSLALTPDTFACGIDISGICDLVHLMESFPPWMKASTVSTAKYIGDPTTPDGRAGLLEVSPSTHVDKITKPLLVFQGGNDPLVPDSDVDTLVANLKGRGVPVTYVWFGDEGHTVLRPKNVVALLAIAEAFLAVHLGGAHQPILAGDFDGAPRMKLKEGGAEIPGLRDAPR